MSSASLSLIPRVQPKPPLYPSHYLYGLTDVDRKATFDVKQVIICFYVGIRMNIYPIICDVDIGLSS